MRYNIKNVIDNISFFNGFTSVEKVKKGYSPDDKYIVLEGRNKYLLRISDYTYYQKREAEYKLLQELEEREIQSQRPILFGNIERDNICYMVIEFMEGTPAVEAFNNCSSNIQHQIGIQAGKELYKIHQIEAPLHIPIWKESQRKKFNYYLNEYKNGHFRHEQDKRIISFIEENMELLGDRTNTLLHDDFHLEHIILSGDRFKGIIDFNGHDYGDPYHDFYNLALFSRRISIPYCIGQIEGYFSGQPDDYFWKVYSLYAAMNIFSTIVWTTMHDPASFEDALERIEIILEDHDNFERIKPKWYKS
ncbi:aminoglycoside phosphotransferase family protein [Ornithinibacillus scapharcae]|uniref:aminoglycoside phosphotransferase family protein n=1 Tax=Ornithinibacillus scapharcae TaxID=1147159 RepID=UPI000225B0D4|nr:aminoglycoside phosphotransferase family protein [Ornithinibacillus scapharcae]